MNARLAAAAVLSIALAGAEAAPTPLAGTAWHLQALQSMDDAQGTTAVADPGRFRLEFGPDGRAALRLDCNRASSRYEARPAAEGSSGALRFGAIAATRSRCAPPDLGERVLRQLPHVRSYRLHDGRLFLSLWADGGILEWAPAPRVLRGQVVGRRHVDHPVRAAAGQRLELALQGAHGGLSFNLLPPGSADVAMALGERLDHRFDGLVPDDGVYTVRVFLARAAARRGERAEYRLSVALSGAALPPLPATADALVPGTRFHARAEVPCAPAFSGATVCEASVVRRGVDGTATVELRWAGDGRRRILFVGGEPKAADTPQAMDVRRDERGWRIGFDGGESFEIPLALVFGG